MASRRRTRRRWASPLSRRRAIGLLVPTISYSTLRRAKVPLVVAHILTSSSTPRCMVHYGYPSGVLDRKRYPNANVSSAVETTTGMNSSKKRFWSCEMAEAVPAADSVRRLRATPSMSVTRCQALGIAMARSTHKAIRSNRLTLATQMTLIVAISLRLPVGADASLSLVVVAADIE